MIDKITFGYSYKTPSWNAYREFAIPNEERLRKIILDEISTLNKNKKYFRTKNLRTKLV